MAKIKKTDIYPIRQPDLKDFVPGTKVDENGKTVSFSIFDIASLASVVQPDMIVHIAEMIIEDGVFKVLNSVNDVSHWRKNNVNYIDIEPREFSIPPTQENYFRTDLLLVGTNPSEPFIYLLGEENETIYKEPDYDKTLYLKVTPIYVHNLDISNPEPPITEPYVFTKNFIVSLPEIAPGIPGRFGKYLSGETIPAIGKDIDEFIEDVVTSALEPTVGLTSSTVVQFNQTDIENVLNLSYVINSLGGVVDSVSLEWRRNNAGDWTELTDDSDLDTFTHSLTDSNFNTEPFNYRYTVTDDKGGTKTVTLNITPAVYVKPTILNFSAGADERDRGNISSSLSGTISRNSPLVDIIEYKIQYQVDGTGSWHNLGDYEPMSASGGPISGTHDDSDLLNSASLSYRVLVTDEYETTTLSGPTVTFLYRNLLGYSSNTVLTLEQILTLTRSVLSNSKSRTITNVTAEEGYYTYYAYRAGAGDLTGVIQNGASPVLGAFTKLTDVSGTNSFGASVTYRIYKSNAPQAFTSDNLAFS